MRGRQQLVSIRSIGDALVCESLRYGDEVVQLGTVLDPEELVEPKAKEVQMAKAFLESLEVDFDPSRYQDDYQVQLAELIERKAAEGDIAVQPEDVDQPSLTPAIDIMAALEASLQRQLDSRSEERATRRGSGGGATKRTAASTKKTGASTKAKAKR